FSALEVVTMFSRVSRAALLGVFAAAAAFSQANNGRISGTVTDKTASVIAGATVTVVNQATNVTQKVTTNANGFYIVPDLPVGTFTVTAEHAGFRKAEKKGIDLVDRGAVTADFKLEVGALTDSVT